MTTAQQMVSVYGYTDVRAYLHDVFRQKKRRNPRFSLRAWAKQLRLRSPSHLIQILSGDKHISADLGKKLGESLLECGLERRYFLGLVRLECAENDLERTCYRDMLEQLRPLQSKVRLSQESFLIISDWFHFLLLEMCVLHDFDPDPEYFRERLFFSLGQDAIVHAINRLVKLGLLRRTDDGKLFRTKGTLVLDDEKRNLAVKLHHRQMMKLAARALDRQSIVERDFRASRIGIRKSDFTKAKRLIKDFHSAMQKLAVDELADDIYAVNTQFFRLTKKTKAERA